VFSQKRRVIKVRIGKPISVNEQNEHHTRRILRILRKKTYMLANPFERESIFANTHFKNSKVPKQLLPPASQDKMIKEVDALRSTDCRFAKQKL
jgi:hypothetical protein